MPSNYPKFQHHGAETGVTGSCHRYIAHENAHYLVDCGLFQGEETELGKSPCGIDFDITQVKALIVTHVHIDHIGRLPYLMAAGFKGPIYCSIPSAELLPLVIEDALKIGFTRDKRIIHAFLDKVAGMLRPLQYGQFLEIENSSACTLRLKLKRAGHILGSAYVELDVRYPQGRGVCRRFVGNKSGYPQGKTHRSVFSGDLGAPYAPLLPAPRSPYQADTVVLESTYGDKNHPSRRERKTHLKQAIEYALQNGGTVMVPAFSIGRTQELLYELESLIYNGDANWRNLEIIVDSPLAAKFTEVYKKLKPYWDAEAQQRLRAGRHPLSFDNLLTINSHQEHLQTVNYLAKTRRPAVVLAASGMANGGRIVNYLKAMLEDPHHAVLFVGYQARGTYGHTIQKYGKREDAWVEIDGERFGIRAMVQTISAYSAHADQQGLLNFVKRMRKWPRQIRLVHGDLPARLALKKELENLANKAGTCFEIWTATP